MKSYRLTCFYFVLTSIFVDQDIILEIFLKDFSSVLCTVDFCLVCIIESKDNIISTTVDDILQFVCMIMHRRYLATVTHHDLFCIRFLVLWIVDISVTDGDQCKTQCIKFSFAVIGNIPAKLTLTDFIILMIFLCPLVRCERKIWRKFKSAFFHQCFHFFDCCVDL